MGTPEGSNGLSLDAQAQELIFREARTAFKFSDEPVSEDQLKAIHDLVKNAPTSLNTQPLRVVVVRSKEARERLVSHMWETNQEKTANAPLSLILGADLQFQEELPRLAPHVPAPVVDKLFADPAVREESAKLNATLQIGYFILGVRAAGLAAGPMTGFNAKGVDAEFFKDGNHSSLVVMNVGVPAGEPPFPRLPRLDYDDVFETV